MYLNDIANSSGSDKGSKIRSAHSYTQIYEFLFSGMREKSLSILEIGLAIGGPEHGNSPDRAVAAAPSIDMWKAYFPNAKIIGFDISDFSSFQDDRFTFVRGDAGNREDLEKLLRYGPFDIIIDDASHASFHQMMTFGTLMGAVKPGGLFIIEDLQWQPQVYENSLPKVPKMSEVLAAFLAHGGLPPAMRGLPGGLSKALDSVYSVNLFRRDVLDRAKYFRRVRDQKIGPRPPSLRDRWRVIRNWWQGNPIKLAILQKAAD